MGFLCRSAGGRGRTVDRHAMRARRRTVRMGVAIIGVAMLLLGLVVFDQRSVEAQSTTVQEAPSADRSPGHRQMLALLQQIAAETDGTNEYIGEGLVRLAREELAALPTDATTMTEFQVTSRLADEELRVGNQLEAIRYYTHARDLMQDAELSTRVDSLFSLGIAYLRLGETQNCALNHSADSCILPLRGGGIHTLPDPSRNAIAAFTEILEILPEFSLLNRSTQSLQLAARWLLNIGFITIGGYPDQVPEAYLIPPSAFESDESIPRFDNIAPHLGIDTFDLSGGAIADDFDNDGYLDLVESTWDPNGQMRFFRNNRDGTFTDQTQQAGLEGLLGGLNLVQADYDNDSYVDVLVLRGAWMGEHGQHPNSLLRNNGDGTFSDVTFDVGLGDEHYPTQTASWADYDNDGDLDLYVGNEWTASLQAPSQLFRNNNDGTFTDVAVNAGVTNERFTKAVIWGDYDDDRFPDLFVSNLGQRNRFYRNNGDGTFTDVAEQLDVAEPLRSFPAWFWDFDNDGALDLFISTYHAKIYDLAASALGLPVEGTLAGLHRGTGDGRFEEVSAEHGLVAPTAPMGANFGDLDNDGYLDFYLGTGDPFLQSVMPNVMYRNQGGTRFTDVTYSGGFGHLQKGHAVVFADFDNDGDNDVFQQMGGAFPVDGFNNALYENPGFGHHWVTVQLVGDRSNRSAIGARLHVQVTENGTSRSIYRHVNSGGSFGANPLRQTIGLGAASNLETLEVFWPTTGITQTFTDVPIDRVIRIVENDASYEIVPLESVEFHLEHEDMHVEPR